MIKLNIQRNKLSVIFSSLILIFMLILSIKTLGFNEKVRTYPSIFIAITTIAAFLKIITSVTNSKIMRKLDNLTSAKDQEDSENSFEYKEEKESKLSRELFSIFSYITFFIFIYLLGFIIGVFIFVLTFNLLNSNFPWKKALLVAISLTLLTYIAEEFLMKQTWTGIIF